jgi:Mor family transcriptional regulator
MVMAENDIVKDILARVQEFVGPLFFTNKDAQRLELDIKNDWGGDKPTINTARQARIDLRNKNVIDRWDSGVKLNEISREFHISKRMIYRILDKHRRL